MDIKEIKKDLLEYDLYYLLDGVRYGDYFLSIFNEDDLIIHISDNEGFAAGTMTKEDFLRISTTEELKKHINSILYYNYNECEEE